MSKKAAFLLEDLKKDLKILEFALDGNNLNLYADPLLMQTTSFYSTTIPFILAALKKNYPELHLNLIYIQFCWWSFNFITGDPFKKFLATLKTTRENKFHILYGDHHDYTGQSPEHRLAVYLERNSSSKKFKAFVFDAAGIVLTVARLLHQCQQQPEIEKIYVMNQSIQKSPFGCDTFAIAFLCDISHVTGFFELLETGTHYQKKLFQNHSKNIDFILQKLVNTEEEITSQLNSPYLYRYMEALNPIIPPYFSRVKLQKAWSDIEKKTFFINLEQIVPDLNFLFRNIQDLKPNTISKKVLYAPVSFFPTFDSKTSLAAHIQQHQVTYQQKEYSSALLSTARIMYVETIKNLNSMSNQTYDRISGASCKKSGMMILLGLTIFVAIFALILKLIPPSAPTFSLSNSR